MWGVTALKPLQNCGVAVPRLETHPRRPQGLTAIRMDSCLDGTDRVWDCTAEYWKEVGAQSGTPTWVVGFLRGDGAGSGVAMNAQV
jgi:hypothetical protein